MMTKRDHKAEYRQRKELKKQRWMSAFLAEYQNTTYPKAVSNALAGSGSDNG